MLEKVAKVAKRAIVRMQPYLIEAKEDIIKEIPNIAKAGAYGITIEAMKFAKKKPGLIKVGNDFTYYADRLKRDYEEIRAACHENGLKFYCAENRLRAMGDSLTCCGCDGLEGFKQNKYNLEHLLNGDKQQPTAAMKRKGSASCFKGIYQSAGASEWLKKNSFQGIMEGKTLLSSYKNVVSPDGERGKDVTVAKWLVGCGFTAKEINQLTGTKMGALYLCVKANGKTVIPGIENFEKIIKSEKVRSVPPNVRKIIYGR